MFVRRITGLAAILACLVMVAFHAGHGPERYQFPKLLHFPVMPVAEDNPVTIEGVELGRYLFYDPILSADSSFSCASCHHREVAFSDAPRVFSRGIAGRELHRNTMPLFNLAWYSGYFWDGKSGTLEEQVFHPVRAGDEMNLPWARAAERINKSDLYPALFEKAFGNSKIDSVLIAKAIAQFERTLISYNSKYDSVLRGEAYFTPEEYRGFALMHEQTKGDCLHCHSFDANALGTNRDFSNNGLDAVDHPTGYKDPGRGGITSKEKDVGLFRIPTLRNVAVTAPYMHDGRFAKLEEVMDFYSDEVQQSFNVDSRMGSAFHGGIHLTEEEKASIIAFLHTLTDHTFLNDPRFGNPFIENSGK